jgi:GNAT superfamily N-acetyltransferase
MPVEVVAEHQGAGLGTFVLSALKEKAREHGLPRMIGPVRPTLKTRYPLVPIDRYASWVQEDGTLFDHGFALTLASVRTSSR